jgi:exonuclease III
MAKIATFNVNGVNGRLPVLLQWLRQTNYDIVCLQELKTSDEKFPVDAIREAGYGAIDAVVPRRWLGDAVFFPESRQAYAMMLDQGWIDAIRRTHLEKGVYTYWNFSYGGGYDRSSGLRMDHLLISPSVASRLTDAGVDTYVRSWEKPSDHAPSWIEIE